MPVMRNWNELAPGRVALGYETTSLFLLATALKVAAVG
jgi:hypothetical protein